jgi:phage N-6-adenine-methyltransferase
VNEVRLIKYDAACRALSEAKSVDEVKAILDPARAMQAAARVSKNTTLEADAFEIRTRAERKLGELLRDAQRDGMFKPGRDDRPRLRVIEKPVNPEPPKQKPITLPEIGIDKNLAHRARRLVEMPRKDFEDHVKEQRRLIEEEQKRKVHVLKNTGDTEWYTPPAILDAARSVLGEFDLDPASSQAANETVGAARFYAESDDGLSKEWAGRVWLNPPYAEGLVDAFVSKLVEAVASGAVTNAILLVNNATETGWFQKAAGAAAAICFPKGRIRFLKPGEGTNSPLQGQALLYFGRRVAAFVAGFQAAGVVVKR